MWRRTLKELTLMLCCGLGCFAQGPSAIACLKDLETIPGFLLENDTGARDHLAQFGQKHFDDALAEAKSAASQIRGNASCAPVITKYLRAWRRGHMGVEDIAPTPAPSAPQEPAKAPSAQQRKNTPAVDLLSAKTLRLTLRSFADDTREPLIAAIKEHRRDLESHPNWIIDVRGNGGGSDGSYRPLMSWLMAGEMASAGTEILVTRANIENWARLCALYAAGDPECPKTLSDPIARMRKGALGAYVPMDDNGSMSYYNLEALEPRRPARVAILTDRGCASSCEQFVLEARQSYTVKVIGQRTFGSLDYSNLRPHDLPSGRRRLWYATTRSTRIPGMMVDVAGLPPDIYLPDIAGPDAQSEMIARVHRWLEGGSLAPRKAQ